MTMTYEEYALQADAECGGPALLAWPSYAGGKLRPSKGGGDGGAHQMELDRQRRSAEAIDQINGIFNGANRHQLYDTQQRALTDLNTQEVSRQFGQAERENRFGLARTGLLGGAMDIDSNAELQRRKNEGLMKAAGIGNQAASDLRMEDERMRQNLVSTAQSGIDSGQAAQLALSGLETNSQNAMAARSGASIGSLFDNLSSAYLYGKQLLGQRAGSASAQPWAPGTANSVRGGDTGRVV